MRKRKLKIPRLETVISVKFSDLLRDGHDIYHEEVKSRTTSNSDVRIFPATTDNVVFIKTPIIFTSGVALWGFDF